jgi:hypothetical protein
MGFADNPVLLVPLVVAWLLIYHIVYSLIAVMRDDSLVCWSVGPLGIGIVGLRQPPWRRVLAQLGCAGLAFGLAVYVGLFVLAPGLIPGLDRSSRAMASAVVVPVVAITLWRIIGILREKRVPIWGEARVLALIQRSAVSGALIFFTPSGRAFLRDRFNVAPRELVRMLRTSTPRRQDMPS